MLENANGPLASSLVYGYTQVLRINEGLEGAFGALEMKIWGEWWRATGVR
jgi:hypothetical protein